MGTHLLSSPAYAPRLGKARARRLLLCFFVAVSITCVVQLLRQPVRFDDTAVGASKATLAAMKSLKTLRARLNIPVDANLDPAMSGLIGVDYSDLTTTLGALRAKQTSLNPHFSALIVVWLKQAGVRSGDTVALSLTGSFPALNLAALNACAALALEPVIVSSVGSSSYGANIPGFTWLDMERYLHSEGLLPWQSQYASLGGIVETGGGLDGSGYTIGEEAIAAHGAHHLHEDGQQALVRDIENRFALYSRNGLPKAFINVGGSIAALGWIREAALLSNGLLRHVPRSRSPRRGLIFRMAESGVPVIHMINIERLAADNHLPIAPTTLNAEMDLISNHRMRTILFCAMLAMWCIVSGFLFWRFESAPKARHALAKPTSYTSLRRV